jgi:hypothetical protein
VFKVKPLKSHDKSRKWIFDTKIIDKLGKVYDLDIKVKVEKNRTLRTLLRTV